MNVFLISVFKQCKKNKELINFFEKGLLCGVDNCPPTSSFQPDDDCCYNPGHGLVWDA